MVVCSRHCWYPAQALSAPSISGHAGLTPVHQHLLLSLRTSSILQQWIHTYTRSPQLLTDGSWCWLPCLACGITLRLVSYCGPQNPSTGLSSRSYSGKVAFVGCFLCLTPQPVSWDHIQNKLRALRS